MVNSENELGAVQATHSMEPWVPAGQAGGVSPTVQSAGQGVHWPPLREKPCEQCQSHVFAKVYSAWIGASVHWVHPGSVVEPAGQSSGVSPRPQLTVQAGHELPSSER